MSGNGKTLRPQSKNARWNKKFAERLPRVFIGICSFQDIPQQIYHSHMVWALAQGARLAGKFELSFGIARRMEQYRARNYLIRSAQQEGADFMLMIDGSPNVRIKFVAGALDAVVKAMVKGSRITLNSRRNGTRMR